MSEVSPQPEVLEISAFIDADEKPSSRVNGIVSAEDPAGSPFTIIEVGDEEPIGNGDAVIVKGLCVGESMERVPTALGIEPELEPRVISTRAKLLMAACLGMVAFSACEQGHSSSDNAMEKMTAGLSMDDLNQLSPQQLACFTQPGDKKPSVGTFNGEAVITFIRENPATGQDACHYVKAADILSAVEEACEAKIIEVPGVVEDVRHCAIDEDKIYYDKHAGWEQVGELIENNGNFEVSNPVQFGEWDSPNYSTIVQINGVSHLVYDNMNMNLNVTNLTDGTTQTYPYNIICGIPHKDADTDTWVGGKLVGYGGVENCMLVKSATLEGLMSSLQFVPGIMIENNQIIGDAKSPRIMGNVMIFQGTDSSGSQIWYAALTPPDNPDVGPDVQEQDLGEQDTGVLPDLGEPDLGDPDTGVLPDLGDPDTGVEPDLGEPDTWVEPDLGDPDTGPEPDTAELPDTQVDPEDTAEPSDTSIPGDESSGPEEISQPDEISDAIDAAEEAWKEIIETSQPDELEGPDELTIPDEASAPDEFTQPDEVSTPDELAQLDESSTPDKGQKDHGTLPEWGTETTIVDVVGKDLPGPDNSGPEVSTGTPGGGCSSASEGQGQTRNSLFLLLGSIGAMMAARLRRKENEEEQVR